MNPVNKTHFPKFILEYYERHQHEDNKEYLTQILTGDEATRKAFLDWTKTHKSFAKEGRLSEAKKIAKRVISNITTTQPAVLCITGSSPISMDASLRGLIPEKTIENFSKKNAITALTLYRLNLINKEQFTALFNEKSLYTKFTPNKLFDTLCSDSHVNRIPPILDEKIFDAFLPYLDSLPDADFMNQLSLEDENQQTPLYVRAILQKILPLLPEKKSAFTLLSHRDVKGNTPLHYANVSHEQIIPLLKSWDRKLGREYVMKILFSNNCEDFTPLQYGECLTLLIPLLEYFISEGDLNSVAMLLSTKEINGKTLLHRNNTYKILIPVLKQLGPEILSKQHSIRDDLGMTPLHYRDLLPLALENFPHFLSEKYPLYLIKHLTIRNKDGSTPLCCARNRRNLIPLLISMCKTYPRSVVALLLFRNVCGKDACGRTLLHYCDTYRELIPVLKQLELDMLSKLHATEDDSGKTPLDYRGILLITIEHFPDLILEKYLSCLVKYFTTEDIYGCTPLHYPEDLKDMVPFLISLCKKHPLAGHSILSFKDRFGKTFLHYGDLYRILIPVLKELEPDMLSELHSIPDNTGKTPVQYDDILAMAKEHLPFFKSTLKTPPDGALASG